MATELSIVIPTYRRRTILGQDRPVLAETLARLVRHRHECPDLEILVVYHGPPERREETVGWLQAQEVRLLQSANESLAAARNVALDAAQGSACLFLNDDAWACAGLLRRHARFHRQHPDRESALLGRVFPARDIELTQFMHWLDRSGIQFGYDQIDNPERVSGRHLYTINASVKTSLVREVGGFDERFPFGNDDNELGLRLQRAGMRLEYDPRALAEHHHPIDLAGQLGRIRAFGEGYRRLVEAFPDQPSATRPSIRHRVAATALSALWLVGARQSRVRHAIWRFLCHEAHREGFWQVPTAPSSPVRIGAGLARRAQSDPRAGPPRPARGERTNRGHRSETVPAAIGLTDGSDPTLDVAIVTYRCRGLLRACLESLRRNPPSRAMRVHVVDNASGDGSAEMVKREFPQVRVTPSARNLGFAAATNIAIREGEGDWVLALNPDTRVSEGALDRLLSVVEANREIGICGCRLELEDGTLDHAAKRSFPTPLSALGHFSGLGRRVRPGARLAAYTAPDVEAGPVDAVNGAFMLIRRQALAEVGLFDEGYWMYMEDLDLSYRFAEAGWITWYEPSATVTHLKAGTTGPNRTLRLNCAFHHGMYRFYRKHYAANRNWFANFTVYCGIAVTFCLSAARSAILRSWHHLATRARAPVSERA